MSFKRELKLAISEVEGITLRQVKLIFNDAFVSGVVKTPVDQGIAINSWYCSLGATNNGEGERAPDLSGSASIAAIQKAVGSMELGDKLLLYSNLPYIVRLEDGYSLQAPSGMIKTTVAEFPITVRKYTSG
ncbi:MAG: hypothetical protein VYC55_08095 [Pseudomonadota bacterium]|nr:hypothetical protein [Pseudomonadota bacterium]